MFGGSGRGMGGGGGSGMLRVVGRTVARAGVTNIQEPISTSSATSSTVTSRATHKLNSGNNGNISLTSGSGGSLLSACNIPVSGNHGGSSSSVWPPFAAPCCDDYEWVSVDGSEGEGVNEISDDYVLGPVPSIDEVNNAVSALTQVFDSNSYSQLIWDKFAQDVDKDVPYPTSSSSGSSRTLSLVGLDSDWMEPSAHICNPRMLQPFGSNRVYDAFHLLQNDPTVQRMVISISSDKAVWDAVLNNEVVRELRENYNADGNITPLASESSDESSEDSNPALDFVRWIFDNTKAKFTEVFEKLAKLVNEFFKPHGANLETGVKDTFEEKLRTSFLLSVVVLLVIVATRAQGA